jgi:excisionase family DNA binding protein
MQLEERLYTSTEVAEILGVSLRSIYRYLEEGKLDAEVKTATGRHRFTKQNILDFLYPDGASSAQQKTVKPQVTPTVEEPVDVPVEEEPQETQVPEPSAEAEVDWLAKFRAAAERHRAEAAQEPEPAPQPAPVIEEVVVAEIEETIEVEKESLSSLADAPEEAAEVTHEEHEDAVDESGKQVYYYRSGIGGLKELAQYVNKAARKSNVAYAFTMNAGMSLHKLIRPFSVLHIYVREDDRDFFEKALELSPTDEASAQLAIYTTKNGVLDERVEVHGLYVVSDLQLRKDLLDAGEVDLAGELDEVLNL